MRSPARQPADPGYDILPFFGENQDAAVEGAPDDIVPRGSVPEAAKDHGQHYVAPGFPGAAAAAAQRDEEIVAQPGGQRHVPAMPELGEIGGEKRSEEHTSELQSRFDLVCRL